MILLGSWTVGWMRWVQNLVSFNSKSLRLLHLSCHMFIPSISTSQRPIRGRSSEANFAWYTLFIPHPSTWALGCSDKCNPCSIPYKFDFKQQLYFWLYNRHWYQVGFDSQFPRERFQDMCKTLRVLNAVRNHEIGIPLSIQQYKVFTFCLLIIL